MVKFGFGKLQRVWFGRFQLAIFDFVRLHLGSGLVLVGYIGIGLNRLSLDIVMIG